MKKTLTLSLSLVAMTALAHTFTNNKSVKTKQDALLESKNCRATYDEIREQLQDGDITIEQAQKLWLQHREQEKIQGH